MMYSAVNYTVHGHCIPHTILFIRLNAAAFINFRTYFGVAFIRGWRLFCWTNNYHKNVHIIMALSKASKDGTSRFVNCTRLKQNLELLDKPVSLCNKAIHACHLQSISSFLSSSDLTRVYMMSTNDICVKVYFFVIGGNAGHKQLALAGQCVYWNEPLPCIRH